MARKASLDKVPDSVPGKAPDSGSVKAPESIPALLWLMAKGMVLGLAKNFLWKLLLAVGTFVAVMGINYYYVAVRNEGFGSGPVNDPNSPLYGFFNVGANQAAFNVWVFLGGMLLSTVFGQIRLKGFKRFFQELFQLFHWTGYCIAEAGRFTLPAILFPMAITVSLGIFLNSLPLFLTLAIGQFFGYISQNTDLTSLFARCGWFDIQRIFRRGTPRREINAGVSGLLSLGILLGAVILALVPPMHLRLVSILLAVLLIALGVLSLRGGRANRAVAALLIFVGINLLWFRLFGRTFADDGGADEVGGTIIDYANDPGGRIVLANGAKSGFFGALGTFVGSGFNWVTGKMAKAANAAVDGVKAVANAAVDGVKTVANTAVGVAKDVVQVGKDLVDPAVLKEFVKITVDDAVKAKDALVSLGKDAAQLGRDAVSVIKDAFDPTIMGQTLADSWKDLKSGLDDIWNHPEIITDTLKGSWQTTKDVGKGIANTIYTTITDPKKVWEIIKDSVGASDYGKSLDPNLPAHVRIGHSLTGTFKLGMTILTLGQVKVAAVGLKTALAGGKAALPKVATGLGKGALPKGIKPPAFAPKGAGLPRTVPGAGRYTPSGRAANLSGMSNKSQKAIQVVSNDMGLQVHVRPTSSYAKAWRESGKALPKPMDLKMKSFNEIDKLLGAPPNREGLVGIYRPTRPPKNVMSRLSPDLQRQINERFNEQAKTWRKYRNNPPDGYEFRDGLAYKKGGSKPFCSDNDLHDITSFDGKPVPPHVQDEAIRRIQRLGGDVEHRHHMDPKWKTPGGEARKGRLDIMNQAKQGGKGVNTFQPNEAPTHSWMTGRTVRVPH